jgi:hypothetical protein
MFPTPRHCFAGFIGRLKSGQENQPRKSVGRKMPEVGSAAFYRQQAEHLTFIAADMTNPATRLELLEIAAGFQKLAHYASANSVLAKKAAEEEEASQRVARNAALG